MYSKLARAIGFLPLGATIFTAFPAEARTNEGIAQLFKCNSTANVGFRQSTSKDTHFDYGRTNKVADVVTNSSGGTCGVEFRFDTLLFDDQDVFWYYTQPKDSQAFNNLRIKYIFKDYQGKQIDYTVKAGTNATVKQIQSNWFDVTQKASTFPQEVQRGRAFLDRVQFIFDNKVSSKITLGDFRLLGKNSISTSAGIYQLDLELKGCP